jgi:hypothetical protein
MPNICLRKRVLALLVPGLCFVGIAVWNSRAELAGRAACFAADKKTEGSGKNADNAPFVPPSLAELDANAAWIDQPVKDTLQMLREKQAGEMPLVTVAQALDATDPRLRDAGR